MPVYLYTADVDSAEAIELENRIREGIPHLRKVNSLEELLTTNRSKTPSPEIEKIHVVLPIPPHGQIFEQIATIATQHHDRLFFIFVSNDISANDYKRLVRLGNADWVSIQNATQEILDIIERHTGGARISEPSTPNKPVIAVFLPSAGGVGNSTLAIEAAVQLKTAKATRAVCLIDLDFQTSHVCDLLDIEPRLQIGEIARHPERVDEQLCDSFITQHASGLDVLAVPRNKNEPREMSIAALDALFGIISRRYDFILIDLPVAWVSWTGQILGAADLVTVTGLLTIPGLRQVVDTLAAVRTIDQIPPQIVVALNRCRRRLRGITGVQYVKRMLQEEKVVFIREDTAAAQHSVNTGIPVALAAPRSVISKDIVQLSSLISELKQTRVPPK